MDKSNLNPDQSPQERDREFTLSEFVLGQIASQIQYPIRHGSLRPRPINQYKSMGIAKIPGPDGIAIYVPNVYDIPPGLLRKPSSRKFIQEQQATYAIQTPSPNFKRKSGKRGLLVHDAFPVFDEESGTAELEAVQPGGRAYVEDLPFEIEQELTKGMDGNFSTARDEHGWLFGAVILEDLNLWARYLYLETYTVGEAFDQDIPQVIWWKERHEQPKKILLMALDCIDYKWRTDSEAKWAAVTFLFDWLLYAVGHYSVPTSPLPRDLKRSGEIDDMLRQVFTTLKPFMIWPQDYFGGLLRDLSDETLAFPESIDLIEADLLIKQLMNQKKSRRNQRFADKELLIFDPESDSGTVLLAASNYSLNLKGMTTENPLLSKALLINAYLLAPWILFPPYFNNSLINMEQRAEDSAKRTQKIMARKRIDPNLFWSTEFVPFKEQAVLPVEQRRYLKSVIRLPRERLKLSTGAKRIEVTLPKVIRYEPQLPVTPTHKRLSQSTNPLTLPKPKADPKPRALGFSANAKKIASSPAKEGKALPPADS